MNTSFVFGWAVVTTGSSIYSSHVGDCCSDFGRSICHVVVRLSLFARLIVACNIFFIVGSFDGFLLEKKSVSLMVFSLWIVTSLEFASCSP